MQTDGINKRILRDALTTLTHNMIGKAVSMIELVHLFDLPQASFDANTHLYGGELDATIDLSSQIGPKYCSAIQLLTDTILDPENQLMLDCGQRFEDLNSHLEQ